VIPRISIVMAVRNGERFLPDALASLRAQTFADFELVAVDGASRDRTVALLTNEPYARVFAQIGSGLYAAWNQALAHCSGALISWLDHDDWYAPSKLAQQAAMLDADPRLDAVSGRFRFQPSVGIPLPAGFNPALLDTPQTGPIPGTLLVRRELIDRVGNFNEGFAIAGDVDWIARAKDAPWRLAQLNDVLLHKRLHADNLSSRARLNSAELLRALRASVLRQRR
jgi:glycosyltransferase involved in cell wall biosynthesis